MFARVSYFHHRLRPSTLRASLSVSVRLNMPSNDPNATNASGLTPSETKALGERQSESHESQIIESIKEVSAGHAKHAVRYLINA